MITIVAIDSWVVFKITLKSFIIKCRKRKRVKVPSYMRKEKTAIEQTAVCKKRVISGIRKMNKLKEEIPVLGL